MKKKKQEKITPEVLFEKGEGFLKLVTREISSEKADKLYKKALKLYQSAAKEEYPPALQRIGQFYMAGLGTMIKAQKGFEYLRRAADLGEISAQLDLASVYYFGMGVEQSVDNALFWMKKAADSGNADAMCMLGSHYTISKNSTQALYWFDQSIQAGSTAAKYYKGVFYLSYEGSEQDMQKGFSLIREAAAEGESRAQHVLATLRSYSCDLLSFRNDPDIGVMWLKKSSAFKGNSEALRLYGELLLEGKETEQNMEGGIQFIKWAAISDNVRALVEMSRMCLDKTLPCYSPKHGLKWGLHAAKLGGDAAMQHLAWMRDAGFDVDSPIEENDEYF